MKSWKKEINTNWGERNKGRYPDGKSGTPFTVLSRKEKKEKRHSVFLFSLLLVFILSYWPTTLASLRSRPAEPYSTSNCNNNNKNNIQSISIWDFFTGIELLLFTARGVFLFLLVCPFRSPLSFTCQAKKSTRNFTVKTFSPKFHFGKEFSKKEVIWSLSAGLDDWPNCITSIRCAMRKPVSSSERDADSFQEFSNWLGEHLFDAQGFATFKEVDKPHSVLLFRALWLITSFVGRRNVSLNWSELARLFGVVYKMFSGGSNNGSCCWIINQVPPSI